MQFVAGVSLENHLGRHGALTWQQARPLCEGIADGLRLAHARGIVHRDIKPANILLRRDGSGVLVDFGLAGIIDAGSKTGRAGYTPLFAAPEQLRSGQADARSDVFSLAATLYYCLLYNDPTRREPHCFKAALAPEPARALLMRSRANDPAERPQAAADFLAGLRTPGGQTKEKQGRLNERHIQILKLLLDLGGKMVPHEELHKLANMKYGINPKQCLRATYYLINHKGTADAMTKRRTWTAGGTSLHPDGGGLTAGVRYATDRTLSPRA